MLCSQVDLFNQFDSFFFVALFILILRLIAVAFDLYASNIMFLKVESHDYDTMIGTHMHTNGDVCAGINRAILIIIYSMDK